MISNQRAVCAGDELKLLYSRHRVALSQPGATLHWPSPGLPCSALHRTALPCPALHCLALMLHCVVVLGVYTRISACLLMPSTSLLPRVLTSWSPFLAGGWQERAPQPGSHSGTLPSRTGALLCSAPLLAPPSNFVTQSFRPNPSPIFIPKPLRFLICTAIDLPLTCMRCITLFNQLTPPHPSSLRPHPLRSSLLHMSLCT